MAKKFNKDLFVKFIERRLEDLEQTEKLSNYGIDIYDCKVTENGHWYADELLKIWFDDETIDTIYWWLYEYDHKETVMFDENGQPIPMETIDDLWNYCKEGII